ncbi:MAG: lysine--tRNA ligase [Phycisphaerales bacterium]|jgi:lysyl-tRNA synthetase, class II|nr:lysine--tRNA ligase [Phycisphaerales bacterium]MBT7171309.1 lysine--tRNA ligase [Phycisphaerales bacterium]
MLSKVQEDRQKKMQAIDELGLDPRGWRYDNVEPAAEIKAGFIEDAEEGSQSARAAGRIVLFRDMGKMMFATLRDSSGQIQIALRKNILDETTWALAKNLDLGDIVGADGPIHRTRTGELTIWATSLTMLSKSLRPMPEKFHGLSDVEIRYRQRYLDLMTNPDSMATFKKRIEIIDLIRETLRGRRYMEVETPMMQSIYGGAAARPFVTHHNTFDCDLFMRISPELYLKRLLVGGMERVFEINRNFRNEGVDTSHNPEFTMMELYEAYADYNVMMEIAEDLFCDAAEKISKPALIAQRDRKLTEIAQIETDAQRVLNNKRSPLSDEEKQAEHDKRMARHAEETAAFPESPLAKAAAACEAGGLVLSYGEILLDFARPWTRAKYADLLQEHAGVSMDDVPAVRAKARELHIEEEKLDDAVVINEVFEATVEDHLVQPTFVCDYPAAICPLTRRDPNNPDIALRFELFAANMELANAYTELNDPEIQQANLAGQLKGEEDETMRVMDEDFITALEHGMPPAGGMGIGIDRMVMLLTDSQSIRDVVLFPLLRPITDDAPTEEPQDAPAE